MAPSQTSILNLIPNAIAVRFTDKLITKVQNNPDPGADAGAGLVMIGKLQDDPTVTELNILIRPGGEDWPHTLNLHDGTSPTDELVHEMGGLGTIHWRRRFLIKLKLVFPGEFDPLEAHRKSNLVLSRTENALESMVPFRAGPDSFGERSSRVEVNETYLTQGGGPGIFFFRGELKITVFTQKDIVETD